MSDRAYITLSVGREPDSDLTQTLCYYQFYYIKAFRLFCNCICFSRDSGIVLSDTKI